MFAQIKPTTQTRIDLGFALKDMKATGRLIDTGGFAKKDRITLNLQFSILRYSPILLPIFIWRLGNTRARLCHPNSAENHLSTLNTNHAQEGV